MGSFLVRFHSLFFQNNLGLMSLSSVTFHKVSIESMYLYDFLIYDLCVWGFRNCQPATFTESFMREKALKWDKLDPESIINNKYNIWNK